VFEQDYVMRQIKELTKALAKILFNVDSESPSAALIRDMRTRETADDLIRKIDNGRIHEAENELSELLQDRTMDNFWAGIVFYSYLNEKDDDTLENDGFSREKIKNGINHLVSEYGMETISDLFFYDI